MRVVQLDFADSEFPASLIERDPPELPAPDWVRVDVSGGGICGSDLHIFQPTTGPTPALVGYGTLPMEMGHEVAGRVSEVGRGADIELGTRVAIDPVIACSARGIDPLCERCAAGQASSCRHIGSAQLTPGMGLGFTSGLGGGWGDQVVAHESQLHPLPDSVAARLETLPEPLSIAVHGLLRTPPPPGGPVLVMGAGIIGLLTVVAIRQLFPGTDVVVVAKHPHQADAARACGAQVVVEPGDDLVARLAGHVTSPIKGDRADAILTSGFPYVVEAVGNERSLTDCLRCVDTRGTVLLLGAAGVSTVDLTPVWFKEATVVGSFVHAHDPAPSGTGPVHSFDQAITILADDHVPASLVTHEFALHHWREALHTAMGRGDNAAIKVVLRP